MSLNYAFSDEDGLIRPMLNPPSKRSEQCFWTFKHSILALLILFPYISIPILFGIVSNIKPATNNYYQATVTVPFPVKLGFSNDLKIKESISMSYEKASGVHVDPLVLSLNSLGQVQLGAGTTIYKNQSNYISDCPNYVDLDAVFGNSYILSYFDNSTMTGKFSIARVSAGSNQVSIVSTTEIPYIFYELVVLDEYLGTFVFISQDTKITSETAYLVAGSVDSVKLTVAIGNAFQYADTFSLNPSITKLSTTSFAITYYDFASPKSILTRFGVVNNDLSIALSEPYLVTTDSDYSVYNSLVGLTETEYLVSFYDSNSTDSSLKTVLAVVTINSDNMAASTVSVSKPYELKYSQPQFYLKSTRISNDTAIIVFSDVAINNGLRAIVINVAESPSGTISYGASLQVTSGQTLKTLSNGIIPDLNINTIFSTYQSVGYGAGVGTASISVFFSDYSNSGASETVLLQLSPSGSLVRASPNYVLNSGNPSYETMYTWGAVATGFGAPYQSQTLFVSAITDLTCSSVTSFEFSIMDVLSAPVGLTQVSSDSLNYVDSSVNTIVSGQVSGFSNLKPGLPYYATTTGKLIPGSGYYGRNPGSAYSTVSYVDFSTGPFSKGIITSLDSYVGVAVSTTTLLLKV